jgi:hypothetical protein
MSAKPNPFFRLEDFGSVEISVQGANVTSGTKIPKGTIELTQIHDAGVTVQVPPRSCSEGHLLTLVVTLVKSPKAGSDRIVLTASGPAEEVEGDPKLPQQVRVAFRQYSREDWQEVLDYFSNEQSAANALIRQTRK